MTSPVPVSTRSRIRLVAGATLGLVGGFTTTFFATSSQFVRPITEEFGWGRAELSLVIVLGMLGSALAAPPAGRLVARFGPRPVVAASGVFLAAGLAALAAAPASTGYFALVAVLIGVLAVGTTPVALLATVPRFFDRRFGLALGAVMGLSAIGGAVLQINVGRFLVAGGWRSAYLLLAVVAIATIAITVLIGFPRGAGPERHHVDLAARANAPGLTVGEALRWWPFVVMLGSMLLASIGPVGITLHFVPLMVDRGIDPVAAAGAGAAGGLGLALGRLVSGALLDRVNAVRLTGVILAVSSLGFILPAVLVDAPLPVYAVSALIGGFAFGAEGDILPFLVRRYAGIRHYATVLGVSLGVYGLGAAVGPILFGLSFDLLGSYVPVLLFSAAAMIVAAIAIQTMGPYRFPREQVEPAADATPATMT